MPKRTSKLPQGIKPYASLGLDVNYTEGDKQIACDCPFCGREQKFYVEVETSKYQCKVCRQEGNDTLFLRSYLTDRIDKTEYYQDLSKDKSIKEDTLILWEICQGIDGQWLIPGRKTTGEVNTLYRYRIGNKVFPTAGIGHYLFRAPSINTDSETLFIVEGPWDAMALWEFLRESDLEDWQDSIVIGLPGVNVFKDAWIDDTFFNRQIVICFDSDHPKTNQGKTVEPAGLVGVRSLVQKLTEYGVDSGDISYVNWGENGYDPSLKSGYDVRDALNSNGEAREYRLEAFESLIGRLSQVKKEWILEQKKSPEDKKETLQPLKCESYNELRESWKIPMEWSQGLDTALTVMLAVTASTQSQGDQLWVKILSPPGSGKTTLLEGISVARKHVLSKDTIRGFYSGWRDGSGEDKSIAALADGKTLAVKDGDTILNSPNVKDILSEARGLYDGAGRTHYRNSVERNYEGHKMTWLLCGTSALRMIDESELGTRFLDCSIMYDIDEEHEKAVIRKAIEQEHRNILAESNGNPEGWKNEDLTKAMQLTGGYVEHVKELAANQEYKSQIEFPQKQARTIEAISGFVSRMRARPSRNQEEDVTREFGARLAKQFFRLAIYVALVRNKTRVDGEVMEIVRKVGEDTARGIVLDIVTAIKNESDKVRRSKKPIEGVTLNYIETMFGLGQKAKVYLSFLHKLKMIEQVKEDKTKYNQKRWRLTSSMVKLYNKVMS